MEVSVAVVVPPPPPPPPPPPQLESRERVTAKDTRLNLRGSRCIGKPPTATVQRVRTDPERRLSARHPPAVEARMRLRERKETARSPCPEIGNQTVKHHASCGPRPRGRRDRSQVLRVARRAQDARRARSRAPWG